MSALRILTLLAGGAAAAWFTRKQLDAYEPQLPAGGDEQPVLYQFEYSPFCAKIRHVLAFKGVDYEVAELTPIVHKNYSRRVSGQVKVPYLRHRGQVIADSSAIALYLEQAYPEPAILPADPAAREQVLLLEDWLDESLQPALGKLAYLSLYLNPQPVIDDPKIGTGMPWLDRHKDKLVPLMLGLSVRKNQLSAADLPKLEARLQEVMGRLEALLKGREYLVGEHMSLADLTLLGHLDTARMLPQFRPEGPYAWALDWQRRRLEEESMKRGKAQAVSA